MKLRNKMVKTLLPQIILTQAAAREVHGYGIIKHIRRRFNGVYLGASTVYPALISLEKQGLLKSRWDLTGERPRKVYSLTNKGQQQRAENTTVLAFVAKMAEVTV